MKMKRSTLVLCLLTALTVVSSAQEHWRTRGYDLNRTGANTKETALTQANVNPAQFGKLFSREVDGQIYAQPLVISNVIIKNKGTFNVVFVATMHNSVYAFDADNAANSAPLWKRSFIDEANGITTIPYGLLTGFPDIHPEVGIVSTPAIDTVSKTIYVVVRTLQGDPNDDANYKQWLYALDYRTGETKPGSPVQLTASMNGTGDGSVGGVISYNGRRQNQRPAVVLANGKLYIASASHGDNGPYHGWVLAYDATTLQRVAAYCTTPNGGLGGIWMSGHGMPVDADGNLYFATGNGTFNAANGNYGDSFVKIGGPNLTVQDYFTPYNQGDLEAWDADLGSCGPILIPGTNLLVGGSKESKLYVMNRTAMGGYNPANDNGIVQWWWAGNGHMHCSPVYWTGPGNIRNLYIWSENDRAKAFRFDGSTFNTTPVAVGDVEAPPGMPGGFLTISSNAKVAGTGIVWATLPYAGNANWDTVPGVLRAFRAEDLKEIWNSRTFEDDDYGNFAKFNPPVVINGKVYVPTFSNQLCVYGLMPQTAPPTPRALEAEAGDKEIALLWKASRGATSYEIQRGNVGGSYTKIADVAGGNNTFYVDKDLTNGTTYAYVVVAKNLNGSSGISNEASGTPEAIVIEKGKGISGVYYNDPDDNSRRFVTPALSRLDLTIDYDWGGGSPAAGVTADHFSVIWTGFVSAPKTGIYTLRTLTDDGVRVWFRGDLAINNWTDHAPNFDSSGKVIMIAGRKYPIQMELYENGGGAVGRLYWQLPGTETFEIIPKTSLFPAKLTPQALDLRKLFNLDGVSYASNPTDGNIGYNGQTLAAELLPPTISDTIDVAYSFVLGPKYAGAMNVIDCTGQTLLLPVGTRGWISILGTAINGTQSGEVKLNGIGGVTTLPIKFSDWSAPSPRSGEALAARFDRRHSPIGDVVTATSLYRYRLKTGTDRLVSITLPNNPNMKILAIELK